MILDAVHPVSEVIGTFTSLTIVSEELRILQSRKDEINKKIKKKRGKTWQKNINNYGRNIG